MSTRRDDHVEGAHDRGRQDAGCRAGALPVDPSAEGPAEGRPATGQVAPPDAHWLWPFEKASTPASPASMAARASAIRTCGASASRAAAEIDRIGIRRNCRILPSPLWPRFPSAASGVAACLPKPFQQLPRRILPAIGQGMRALTCLVPILLAASVVTGCTSSSTRVETASLAPTDPNQVKVIKRGPLVRPCSATSRRNPARPSPRPRRRRRQPSCCATKLRALGAMPSSPSASNRWRSRTAAASTGSAARVPQSARPDAPAARVRQVCSPQG